MKQHIKNFPLELSPVLCGNLDGLDGWGAWELKMEGIYVYLWLIHVAIWQKPTQHCKAVILRLKINLKKERKNFLDFLV